MRAVPTPDRGNTGESGLREFAAYWTFFPASGGHIAVRKITLPEEWLQKGLSNARAGATLTALRTALVEESILDGKLRRAGPYAHDWQHRTVS